MIRHYFIIAYRNITRHLNYSLLNIGGLAIGLASYLFIAIYINDEISYDKFHDKSDRIYRVNRLYNSNDVNEDAATCSFPLAPALEFDYPDIVESTCRFFNFQLSKIFFEYREDTNNIVKFNERNFFLVDSTLFNIFTFTFVKGDPATALSCPNTIVLTSSTAKRYFGEENPIGKILVAEEGLNFEVTGVIEDVPSQSHFKFDMLGSMSTFRQLGGGQLPQTWIWNPCWTYVLLHENVSPDILEEKFPDFYINHYPDLSDQDVTLYLQKLLHIHLHSHHDYEMHPNGNILYMYILSAIAFIILVLACINFMSLTTANSASRAKEIGIKKIFGGSRGGLTIQFLGETIILSLIALATAGILIESFLPLFNHFTGKNISSGFLLKRVGILHAVSLAVFAGILAGGYPAIFLSSFKPVAVLQGNLSKGTKSGIARKILVIAQFSISIALIIGTLIIFSQIRFLKNADLGFKKDQIIIIPTVGQIATNYDTFKENLLKYPEVEYVTGMEDIIGVNHNTREVIIEGLSNNQKYWYPMFMVRHDFIETFNIKVVEGRSFSKEITSDTANAIMINENMVKNLGWTNKEAIGKSIRSDGKEKVIGVFSDFHILSLHKPINNFILDMLRSPDAAAGLTRFIAIRVNTNNYKKILASIKNEWNRFAPTRPFEYSFLDTELDSLYKNETKFGKFSLVLTILALFIACFGLVGLAYFLAAQRTKEIGVRRVFGARVPDVVKLLSNEFIRLILVANLIAWPFAYFVTNSWLQNFSQKTDVNWTLYLFAGLITLIISLIITASIAISASSRNPADIIRQE
ncbi:MAG: ABC transporter permease [Bacteroidales bacterium]|nr:ABC transporter permease [Bacteroidales bacterium]